MFWILILIPPLTLLLTLAGGVLYEGRAGDPSAEISARVQRNFSGLLTIAQCTVGVALLLMLYLNPDLRNATIWGDFSNCQRDLGGVLMWLRLEQAGVLAPYLAHLTLNTIEFYVVARRATRKTQSVTEV